MDRTLHSVMKHLNDEKTHAANNSKQFKKLDRLNESMYEVDVGKA